MDGGNTPEGGIYIVKNSYREESKGGRENT
jgi:hypothetical protein